jgi:hypothetical protein
MEVFAGLDVPREVEAEVEPPIGKVDGRSQQIGIDEVKQRGYVADAIAVDPRQHDGVHFMALAHQLARDVRANESRGPRDQDFHSRVPYWVA